MIVDQQRRKIGNEIRLVLKTCSPATIDIIQRQVQPPIGKKDLRQALGILRRNNEVNMLVGDHQTFYYQLSQALPARRKVAGHLNCHPDELIQPLLRRQDWFHNQWCQVWASMIQKQFPTVKIVREHDIGANGMAREILLVSERDIDVLPDFLVMFPPTEGFESINLAFEIERTRKSNARILKKFRKYLHETKIDGLIYVCDSGRLSETIRTLYQEKLIAGATRVKHYGENFFLFSDSLSAGPMPLERLFNASALQVSFSNWCHQLLSTKRTIRRDAQFKDA